MCIRDSPSRITKAYGSFTMKGVSTADRPHRYSRIRTTSGHDAITIMQLAALKPTQAVAKKSSIVIKAKAAEKYATTDGPEKMEEFLEWYDIAHKAVSYTHLPPSEPLLDSSATGRNLYRQSRNTLARFLLFITLLMPRLPSYMTIPN